MHSLIALGPYALTVHLRLRNRASSDALTAFRASEAQTKSPSQLSTSLTKVCPPCLPFWPRGVCGGGLSAQGAVLRWLALDTACQTSFVCRLLSRCLCGVITLRRAYVFVCSRPGFETTALLVLRCSSRARYKSAV